ncbi:histone deacetylase 6-like isoform X2 [Lytechinus variegatus]|uniref:histone deacetylase 6-like isoform X2 n=1 Tax=Lytechinus variegatus TaxID=7654 RepID=UPI001BB1FD5B|nr:histone deacetylase 6-like isoform X2 [Lytechinus variegatus]
MADADLMQEVSLKKESTERRKESEKSSSLTPTGTQETKSIQNDSGGRKKSKKAARNDQRAALRAAKKKGRKKEEHVDGDVAVQMTGLVLDDSPPPRPTGTGLVYDERFKEHYCPIGSDHGKSECPERYTVCIEKLQEGGLLDRCQRVPSRAASDEEILTLHSQEYLDTLKKIGSLSSDELKELAESYDSIYLCNKSFEIAQLTLGGLLDLTEKVVKGELRNGFACIRPPGHHSQRNNANGYSLLNNVALTAKIAKTKWNVDRILIVDWDVHHGQGIQYLTQDDPSIMYFSMHRYEHTSFWPHLEESNYDNIGERSGKGYNINVPWNKIGMGDAEYLAVFQQLLIPLSYEFNPQLVLVCAGFDAVEGDPKGEMVVSPDCFGHMTHHLMGLAQGKVVLSLEGGYCLEGLSQSASICTRTLLGDPCKPLSQLKHISENSLETIHNVTEALKPYWKCFQYDLNKLSNEEPIQSEDVSSTTPDVSHQDSTSRKTDVDTMTNTLLREIMISTPPHRTGLVYDERMKLHRTFNHPERPERIARIYSKHQEHGLLDRCIRLQTRQATFEEMETCHLADMIGDIRETSKYTARELIDKQDKFNPTRYSRDIYVHPDTYLCASLAAGCTLNLVDAVLSNQVLNAVGIVRPPGHHADSETASGFCFFNNVAIASRYAQNKYGVKRVLIVDWDVHHGNGTQRIFETDPSVLYISLHRHDNGMFYPIGPEGAADQVGKGDGQGYNVNIAWNTGNKGLMGDAEYIAAFHHIIMPLAYQFNPELVFISAGFDAAKGDPLGNCLVSPEGYGHMTHMLSSLAGGRVITVLEGGYNLHSIAVSMAMCTRIMLGDPCPDLSPGFPSCCGMQAIYDAAKSHQKFWSSMKDKVCFLETMMYKENGTEDSLSSSNAAPRDEVTSLGPERVDEVSSSRLDDGEKMINEEDGIKDILEGISGMNLQQSREESPGGGRGARDQVIHDDVPEDEALGACGVSDQATTPEAEDNIISSIQRTFGPEVEMHAVIPQPWCPHLESDVRPLPSNGLDVSLPCRDCGDTKENWLCLHCYQVYCGRYVNEHMLMHGLESNHLMVLSYADLSVWCYGCDAYIHNEILIPAKRAAHLDKFGVPGV